MLGNFRANVVNTSNSDPTSFILKREMERDRSDLSHDPFDIKKFSNLSPESLVEWIAPTFSNEKTRKKGFCPGVRVHKDRIG